MSWVIHQGDALDVMRGMVAASVDAIVTDPPYGIRFMQRTWDHGVPGDPYWAEALRVAKPGAHLLAFGGTRTFHRLAVAIEDAGWDIRDTIMWVYGSGFPKSLDVSKAIDKAAGAEREVIGPGQYATRGRTTDNKVLGRATPSASEVVTTPATDAAREFEGYGTALKPSWEPVIVARKPLAGTVAANAQAHGTGALNIDRCRIDGEVVTNPLVRNARGFGSNGLANQGETGRGVVSFGRFPANLIHDGSDEVRELFPAKAGASAPVLGHEPSRPAKNTYGVFARGGGAFHGDSGSAARFFYCAKASPSDRGEWNTHPTVKPLALMQYLCRLVKGPRPGVLLDPFAGSGSTIIAGLREGFDCIGIELDPAHVEICRRRIGADSPLLNAGNAA